MDRLFNWLKGLPFFGKIAVFIAAWLIPSILLLLIFGDDGKNEEFRPQDEFKLHDWIPIHLGPLNLSINRAVLYLFLASALTIWVMVYIARRMQLKPNRTQAAAGSEMDQKTLQAVSQYRFTPATLNNRPVEAEVTVEVKVQSQK